MRQLQLQSGEKAADSIERRAYFVPCCLDWRDDSRLDPVPDGCGGTLDSVEEVCGRGFYGLKRRGDLALDPVDYSADRRFYAVPDCGGGCFDGIENRSNHGLHGIDLCGDDGNDAVPNAGEESNDPVPDNEGYSLLKN